MYLDFLYLQIDLLTDPGVVHVHHVHLTPLLLHQLLGLHVLGNKLMILLLN